MVYAQTRIFLENNTHKLLWNFDIQTDNIISARRPFNNQQKKRTWKIVDFAVPADHRVKLKESEKMEKYLDLIWEMKKLWNMKVTIIPIVIGAFGTVTKGLIKRLEDLKKQKEWRPSKLLHYWERPEYWEVSWRLGDTCCLSDSCERPSASANVKNSQVNNNNDNNNNNK